MYNGSEKENVNVDELVDFLIKRRSDTAQQAVDTVADAEPLPEPMVITVPSTVEESVRMAAPEVIAEPPHITMTPPFAEPELIMPHDEPMTVAEPEVLPVRQETTELPMVTVSAPPIAPTVGEKKKKKRFSLFRPRDDEPEEDEEEWADWGLKPIGYQEDKAVPSADAAALPADDAGPQPLDMDELPAVKAAAETITMQVVLPSGAAVPKADEATRVIPVDTAPAASMPAPAPQPRVEDEDDQLPDQLSLEEMVRVEDIEHAEGEDVADTDEDPAARLQRVREEKVRDFTLDGDEEETNEPDEEVFEEEDEDDIVIEDFTGYEDTKAVALELQYRQRSSFMTLLFTGLLELAVLLLTLLTVLAGESPITAVGYLTAHAFALALMIGLNYVSVGRGLSGLFMLRANSDTAPALAATAALLGVILHFIDTSAPLPYWAPLAGLLLVFSAAGHHARAVGVRRSFAFVSYPREKYAATLIEEENAVREIGRRAAGTGEATVGYFHRTGFLSDYLTNAYEDHRGDDWSRWMAPVALGLSFGLSAVALLGEGTQGFWDWLSVFVGMVCVSMQATHLAVQLPLNQCSRVMLSRGGFLVGWKAVRQFGQLDALVVDVADMYPDESMLLHGIKTFSGTHIDDAILSAASLVVRAGGPLSMIFRRIIENKEELLHDVDSLVYEQGMGLSGWVDGRRVFVGNRRLLQNHGVDVPSSDYEARYAKDGRRLVYLSLAGQLSAMFVVSYLPDPEIQDALQDLCRSHVTLLVRSCDPNITTSDLCSDFDLDEYYVDVLPAAAGRAYMQLAERTSDRVPAVMASNGHILGTAWALSVCRSLRIKSLIALVIQALAAAIGLLLCLVWALQGTLSLFQPLLLLLATFLLTWITPLLKRT